MVRLPKIKIGVQSRKNYFDLSHDNETTSDFGFCQPTIVRSMVAGSSSTLHTNIGVRLAPLPCPTFGRIKLKTYNYFVPMREVFEGFDYMLAHESVSSAFGSYIPEQAPFINSKEFFAFLITYSLSEQFKMRDNSDQNIVSKKNNGFFSFNVLTPKLTYDNIIWDEDGEGEISNVRFVDPTPVSMQSYVKTREDWIDGSRGIEYLFQTAFSEDNSLSVDQDVFEGGVFSSVFRSFDIEGIIPSTDFAFDTAWKPSVFTGLLDYQLDNVERTYFYPRGSASSFDYLLGRSNLEVTFRINPNMPEMSIDVPYIITMNWNRRGQRLFKILNACGLRGLQYEHDLELAKLFAYYKAWFDEFNPGRTQQWRDTPAYRLIHSYYDLNQQISFLMWQNTADIPNFERQDVQRIFADFLVSLSECCYVLPIDNFTAATADPLLRTDAMGRVDVLQGHEYDQDNPEGNPVPIVQSSNFKYPTADLPEGDNPDFTPLSSVVVNALLRLHTLANKNSVIGHKIEDYLRTKYGYTLPSTNNIGTSEQNVMITEIFASAGTSENRLGEIGGRGADKNVQRNTFKFECKEFGIFVQFVAVVPYGDYVQGNTRPKIKRNDFYREEFDSLYYEAIKKSEIVARTNSQSSFFQENKTFGLVPLSWNDKVQNSLHNGAFALSSQRDLFLPYSLDRMFNENTAEVQVIRNDSGVFYDIVEKEGTAIIPNEEMRFVGLTPDLGNYDRIFFDNTGYFDNFILHIVHDWDYYAPMKPISESYDTFDDQNDQRVATVEKS